MNYNTVSANANPREGVVSALVHNAETDVARNRKVGNQSARIRAANVDRLLEGAADVLMPVRESVVGHKGNVGTWDGSKA